MAQLGDGLITLVNGVYATFGALFTPVALFLTISAVCLTWLARLEIAELDRLGSKPEVGRH
jgi:hypothetical protein